MASTRRRPDWDRHAWTLLILSEVDAILGREAIAGRLRRANLAISDRLSRTLGHWDLGRRLITVSELLLRADRWHILVSTLEHEVAHQYVTEVFRVFDEAPHGAAFRRACEVIGADPNASVGLEALDRAEPSDESARVRRKIAKLLALGTSPEKHEAEAALRKAHELALRHNVGLIDGDAPRDYEFRLIGRPMKRVPAYYWTVLALLEEFYFVLYISRAHGDRDPAMPGAPRIGRGRWRVFEIYGTPENLDAAEYVFHYLVDAGEREWSRYRFRTGLLNDRQKLSFLSAMYEGFREKLRTEHASLSKSRALVWRGDPALRSYYRHRNPHVSRRSVGGARRYDEADAAGREAGRRLRIRPGLRRRDGGGIGPVSGLLESR